MPGSCHIGSATGDGYDYSGFASGTWEEGHVAFFVESDDEQGWSDLMTLVRTSRSPLSQRSSARARLLVLGLDVIPRADELIQTSSIATSTSTTSSSSTHSTFSLAAAARSAAPATKSGSPASTTDTAALADSTSSTSSAASPSPTSSSHLSTGTAISVGIALGVVGMAALVGLLFYVYRRGIMAAARGDYRHKEVPSEEPYLQQQQQQQQHQQPPGLSGSGPTGMQAIPSFVGDYASAAAYGNYQNSMPPSSAGGGTFAAGSPPHYSMPPEAMYQAHEAMYPPPHESMYQTSEAMYDYQPPDAIFQQRPRSGTYASSAGPGEGGSGTPGGGGGVGETEKSHVGQNVGQVLGQAAAVAPGQVVAELEREPSRPYAELDPSPRYFAELDGQAQPVAYAELPGARENSR